ncbi:hypothetical protein ACHQM5_023083 [Ranunculus cassubicifolius]
MVSDGEDGEMVTEGGEMPLEEVVYNVESQMGEEVHSVVIETEVRPSMIIEDFEMAAEDGDELPMEEVVYDIESLMREEVYSVVTEEHSPMIEVESLDFPLENSELNVDYQSSEFDFSPTEVPELDVLPEMTELDSSSAQFVEPDTTSLDASSQIQTPELISLRQDMYPPTESTELNGESQTAAVNVMENTFSVQHVVAAISAVFAMVATSVYCYLKHKKPITKVQKVGEPLLKKMMSNDNGDHHEDRFSSRPTEVEMVGESGPEMSSSFKRSLSYGLRGSQRVNEEAQRHEKKDQVMLRENPWLLHLITRHKYGHGEDEVVTPVRRSSRIAKIISPSA